MLITLFIDGKPVETRIVLDKNLRIDGYLEGLQKDMLDQNSDILDLTQNDPCFVVSTERAKKIVWN